MHLQFVDSESTFAHFHAARAYLEAWGKPVAFYSDKHGVFRVNQTGSCAPPSVGRCATRRLRARPRPTVTFVNGRNSDISIWWTHTVLRAGDRRK
jgi:hypothetical protein